jgi:hypothetical protein
VIVLLAAALSGCATSDFRTSAYARNAIRSADVGPFVFDPTDPTKAGTHWHAALGVYDCNHWMGDGGGAGIWHWPNATLQGGPARAADPTRYAGLHSHDDGVIHMEPVVPEEAGNNATLGRYFEYGGWSVSPDGFSFLGVTRKTGDPCGGTPGVMQWEVATWDGTGGPQTYRVQTGDPATYKLLNGDIVVVAFLPSNKPLADIGDPPSLVHLAQALGVAIPPPARA